MVKMMTMMMLLTQNSHSLPRSSFAFISKFQEELMTFKQMESTVLVCQGYGLISSFYGAFPKISACLDLIFKFNFCLEFSGLFSKHLRVCIKSCAVFPKPSSKRSVCQPVQKGCDKNLITLLGHPGFLMQFFPHNFESQ